MGVAGGGGRGVMGAGGGAGNLRSVHTCTQVLKALADYRCVAGHVATPMTGLAQRPRLIISR